MSEKISVQMDSAFPIEAFENYLHLHIPEVRESSLEVQMFTTGRSNPTYLVSSGSWKGVLRRAPFGDITSGAHNMKREHRILELLHPAYPLAPKPYLFSEDKSLFGTPFYIMEYRSGVVIDEEWPSFWEKSPEICRQITEATITGLVDLHAIDYRKSELATIGNPEGFMTRQVHGWIKRYERAKTHSISEVERLAQWLVDKIPSSSSSSVIHNDFKLNNIMLSSEDSQKLVAVLDWELCTIGDPLADFATLLAYWVEPEDESVEGLEPVRVLALPEYTTRSELIRLYASKSGLDVSHIEYYMVYAFFKTAVIIQQLYQRWHKGYTKDERYAVFLDVTKHLFRQADLIVKGKRL